MHALELTAAFGRYDRTEPLRTGAIRPEGIRLRTLTLSPSEIFGRMCRHHEFDLSEMSMGAHCYLTGTGENPFVGIPAFLSRAFRHAMVYVNTGAGITRPKDLNGKRIAIREWGMTALVWIVGILSEEHDLDIASIDWVAVKAPRVPLRLPPGVRLRYMTEGQTLSGMLEAGRVDAALIHQAPACFVAGAPRVQRMFPDYRTREIDYFRRTGVHPIMHCVVLRRELHQRHPWALQSLYSALLAAREQARQALADTKAYAAMIPLLPGVMEDTRQVFGNDFWPYGLQSNRRTLEKLVRYAFEQGLTPELLLPEALFGESLRDL